MLHWRIISSLILIPIILAMLYYASLLWFISAIIAVELVAVYEFMQIASNKNINIDIEVIMPGIVLLGLSLLPVSREPLSFSGALTIIIIFTLIWGMIKQKNIELAFENFAVNSFVIIYIAWFMDHVVLLRELNVNLVFLVLLVTWANDTGAYIAGNLFGKYKLALKISPGKTYEGSIGGIFAGMIITFIIKSYLLESISSMEMLTGGLFIIIAGQLGDLTESAIKRSFMVKDSSDLIPGHGGLLDRIDSLIFAFPIAYYYFKLIVQVK